MFPSIGQFFARLFHKLFPPETQGCHYINGPETLPPPLTKEEEAQVLENIRQGVPGAREPLITHNLRLVVYIAKKFESPGASVEDLISIGTIGLIKAVNTFQVERNIKLATYASRCIENEILMHLRKSSQLRHEVSIDDPLNVDWDGNELLLSDLLGSDPDTVNRDIEQEAERAMLRRAVDRLSAQGEENHGAALWPGRQQGAHPEGGGRPAGHLPILHLPAGEAHHPPAAPGPGKGGLRTPPGKKPPPPPRRWAGRRLPFGQKAAPLPRYTTAGAPVKGEFTRAGGGSESALALTEAENRAQQRLGAAHRAHILLEQGHRLHAVLHHHGGGMAVHQSVLVISYNNRLLHKIEHTISSFLEKAECE